MVNGSGVFEYGTNATIEASKGRIEFFSLARNAIEDPFSLKTNVVVTDDQNVTAIFEEVEYSLKLNANIGGTTHGEGNYTKGSLSYM